MKYFQSDDIPICESKKNCIHVYYRIVVDGKIIKEGRNALKQTRNIKNRIIYKRKYNESKRCWQDINWELKNE